MAIERVDNRLYVTHYLTENGDTFIDSEMVFSIDGDGSLTPAGDRQITDLQRLDQEKFAEKLM